MIKKSRLPPPPPPHKKLADDLVSLHVQIQQIQLSRAIVRLWYTRGILAEETKNGTSYRRSGFSSKVIRARFASAFAYASGFDSSNPIPASPVYRQLVWPCKKWPCKSSIRLLCSCPKECLALPPHGFANPDVRKFDVECRIEVPYYKSRWQSRRHLLHFASTSPTTSDGDIDDERSTASSGGQTGSRLDWDTTAVSTLSTCMILHCIIGTSFLACRSPDGIFDNQHLLFQTHLYSTLCPSIRACQCSGPQPYAQRQWTVTITKPEGLNCPWLSCTHTSIDAIERPGEISARMEAELPTASTTNIKMRITQKCSASSNGQGPKGEVRSVADIALAKMIIAQRLATSECNYCMSQCRLIHDTDLTVSPEKGQITRSCHFCTDSCDCPNRNDYFTKGKYSNYSLSSHDRDKSKRGTDRQRVNVSLLQKHAFSSQPNARQNR